MIQFLLLIVDLAMNVYRFEKNLNSFKEKREVYFK